MNKSTSQVEMPISALHTAISAAPKKQPTKKKKEPVAKSAPADIIYELPLNERIRTFIRLEFLMAQANHSIHSTTDFDSRLALSSILDILSIYGRTDLKTELMKELERQLNTLERLTNSPDIDSTKLNTILTQMENLVDTLHNKQGQIGQPLRENELLSSIRQRSSIAGGTCDFDLPAYHFWLSQPGEKRAAELQSWLSEFEAPYQAIKLILNLIRQSAQPTQQVAENGFFQQQLETNFPYQIIRVFIPHNVEYFAEISGGKHRFTVRFLTQNYNDRPVQTKKNVPFSLASCLI